MAMTKDQKQALKGLAALIGMKAVIYVSIAYAARYYRKTIAKHES